MQKIHLLLICVAATAACEGKNGDAPLAFMMRDDRIVAAGVIDAMSLKSFEDVVADHPGIRRLELQYIGGSVDDEANVEFGRVVRNMGFTTVVPSDGFVASGGTDLFLAGVRRIIEPGACVGVHSWAAEELTARDLPRPSTEHKLYLDYYEDIDVDPAFYWFTLQAAPAAAMHWMTAMEVKQYNVSTKPAAALSPAAICNQRAG